MKKLLLGICVCLFGILHANESQNDVREIVLIQTNVQSMGNCLPCCSFQGRKLAQCFWQLDQRHQKQVFGTLSQQQRIAVLSNCSLDDLTDFIQIHTLKEWKRLMKIGAMHRSQEELIAAIARVKKWKPYLADPARIGAFILGAVISQGATLVGATLFGFGVSPLIDGASEEVLRELLLNEDLYEQAH